MDLTAAREAAQASAQQAAEDAYQQREAKERERPFLEELRTIRQRNHVGDALRALIEKGNGHGQSAG